MKGTFREDVAQAGWIAKLAGVVMLLTIRILEAVIQRHGITATHGAVAAGLTFAQILRDVKSLDMKRRAAGASPWPLLSAALTWFESLERRFIPLPPVPDAAPSTTPVPKENYA